MVYDTLVLVGRYLYVNPHEVQAVHPWLDRDSPDESFRVLGSSIHFKNGQEVKSSVSPQDVVEALRKASLDGRPKSQTE